MVVYRILLLVILSVSLSFAQDKDKELILDTDPVVEQTISEAELEPFLEDEDFNYTTIEAEENILDRFLQWLRNGLRSILEALFGVDAATGILLFIVRILPYLLLAFLVFLLLRFFLKVNSRTVIGKSQPKGEVRISEEEQIIQNEDIASLIKEAVSRGDFRLAIRYYYLLALKYLSLSERISWEPQKTNEDYLNDLKHSPLKNDFEKITKIYDYIWYGDFKIDARSFNVLKSDFETINSKLGNS
jgi:large-conductance mechanosensitive channel